MYARKVASNLARKYATKVAVYQKAVVQEKLQGSTQETLQAQYKKQGKLYARKSFQEISKEQGKTVPQKSNNELLHKVHK